MRVMISADMEGATGVTHALDVEPRGDEWHRFRRLFTGDVNAVATGLFEAGANEIMVNEAHASMRNLLLEDLDPRVTMLTGSQKPLGMMEGVADCDAVAFVGYHSGAGARGVLAHTYLGNSILGVWLDGLAASEGHLNGRLADEYGVPVILVSGDDRACDDADGYAPESVRVAVKKYVSRYAAICLTPTRSAALLHEGARAAYARAGIGSPDRRAHRIEVEFDAVQLADATAIIPTVELVDERRVGFDAPTMTEAMKTFKIVAAIAAGARTDVYG